MKVSSWKKLDGKIIYKNPWIKIHEDNVIRPDGKKGIYGYLEKPTGVFVVAYSSKNKSILLLKQERYPINKTIYELPAGVVGNGNHLSEAKRELFDETGYKAKKWKFLGRFFVAPGHETTDIKVYLATELYNTKTTHREGDEAIQKTIEVNLDDLSKWLKTGKIECGISLAAILLFLNYQYKINHLITSK